MKLKLFSIGISMMITALWLGSWAVDYFNGTWLVTPIIGTSILIGLLGWVLILVSVLKDA